MAIIMIYMSILTDQQNKNLWQRIWIQLQKLLQQDKMVTIV